MYPIARLIKEFIVHRNATKLDFGEIHVSHHMCMPWDIDPWMELNNGRTLTLYDLGRLVLARRSGIIDGLRKNKWSMTMAGANVRYRRRVRMFDRIEMRSRATCWDDRFVYLEQSMWKTNGECAGHIVYRSAFVDHNGIIPAEAVVRTMGYAGPKPDMPDWIAEWIKAEDMRPWPPMQE